MRGKAWCPFFGGLTLSQAASDVLEVQVRVVLTTSLLSNNVCCCEPQTMTLSAPVVDVVWTSRHRDKSKHTFSMWSPNVKNHTLLYIYCLVRITTLRSAASTRRYLHYWLTTAWWSNTQGALAFALLFSPSLLKMSLVCFDIFYQTGFAKQTTAHFSTLHGKYVLL